MREQPAFAVEVPGGSLAVHDLTGGPVGPEAPVVLAIHGITANGLSWGAVADQLGRRRGPGVVRVLAPDLRGRAASREVPGPYGLTAHVGDVVAVAEACTSPPVLVGHSMGAFVAAMMSAAHPDLVAGAVLVDGGLAFPVPEGTDVRAALQAVIGPAMDRLSMRFDDESGYLDFWRAHPAIGPVLDGPGGEAVRRYLVHDLVRSEYGVVSSCVLDAIRADGADVLVDADAHAAVGAAVAGGVPTELVWARRGLLDEPQGLYDEGRLAALGLPDGLVTTAVDANHYDVILAGPGLAAVVDAVERRLDAR